jgi:hypothetical protein
MSKLELSAVWKIQEDKHYVTGVGLGDLGCFWCA